jgi:hypothetical protein
MYIPAMSIVTYVLLSTLLAGLRGQFQPELLGYTASVALAVVAVEILGLKLGCYLLNISNTSQLLDLVAYSGYKFVGVIVTLAVAEIMNGGKGTGGWVGWIVFFYTFLANSLFLVSYSLPLAFLILNDADRPRCALLSMFCCPRIPAMVGVLCRPPRRRNGARGRSFCSSTRMVCSCCSCGYCAGLERLFIGGNVPQRA